MSFAIVGLILVVDQLLVPMFHIGTLPFKVSYFLVAVWFADWCVRGSDPTNARRRRDFVIFALAMGVVVGCALLGEMLLALRAMPMSYGEALRSILIYVLVTLSFGLGLSGQRFELRWLIPVLLTSVALNLSFTLLKTSMPSLVVNFYYSQRDVDALAAFGITSVADILDMARPRGLFSNPNVSALMVNIIVVFIHLAQRTRLFVVKNPLTGIAIVFLPIVVCGMLASRGEFLVATVLGFLNFRLIFGLGSLRKRLRLLVLAAAVAVVALVTVRTLGIEEGPLQSLVRISALTQSLLGLQADAADPDAQLESAARPLLTARRAWDRFSTSPLFGTGFSMADRYPFDYETQYFHNDWFRVAVTSGVIGLLALVWIIVRFCLPLGWPALIPFVLPGMVNTFQLNIPAFMFYFFMVGVLRVKLRAGPPAVARAS